MPLTPEGAARLRVVRDHIKAHPETFDMKSWWCGTVACICGHLLGRLSVSDEDEYLRRGAAYLGVSLYKAARLFFIGYNEAISWPAHFADRYMAACTPEEKATIAADRINDFLLDDGYPPDELIVQCEELKEDLCH